MPANRIFKDIQGLHKSLKVISGSFAPDSGNAPTTLRGRGWSVARVAAGHFRVTLDRKYATLVAALATLQLASADDKSCIVGPYDAENKTLDIFVPDISAFVNEIQTITFDAVPDSGSWTISFGGETTASLAFDDNAAAVEAALETLTTIGDVTVAGDYASGIAITFVDPAGPVAAVTVDDSALESNAVAVTATVDETTPGVSGADVSANANNRVNFKLYVSLNVVGGA